MFFAELFTWVTGRNIRQDQAAMCAKREPGRSWEAIESELANLGQPLLHKVFVLQACDQNPIHVFWKLVEPIIQKAILHCTHICLHIKNFIADAGPLKFHPKTNLQVNLKYKFQDIMSEADVTLTLHLKCGLGKFWSGEDELDTKRGTWKVLTYLLIL